MRIGIAHDYLTQRGGAERVALALLQQLPTSRIYTSLYNSNGTYPEFADYTIKTSYLQRSRLFRDDPRKAFPLLAPVWRSTIADEPLVIASSSGWSHAIKTAPDSIKVVYCHNPPRWLYQPDDYFRPGLAKNSFSLVSRQMRKWDRGQAHNASVYIANSTQVAERIWQSYGITAQVVHPPASIDVGASQDPDDSVEPGYWLAVARGRGYKNIDILVEAMRQATGQRLVIVGQKPTKSVDIPNVHWTGIVTDSRIRWLYKNARALVSVSFEDFGLTPIEANSFGTPALLLRAGGFLETLNEGVSGMYIDSPTANAVVEGMRTFPHFDVSGPIVHARSFSPETFRTNLLKVIYSETNDAGVASLITAQHPQVIDLREAGTERSKDEPQVASFSAQRSVPSRDSTGDTSW